MTTPSKTIQLHEPRKGHGLARSSASIVGPRPIGWISSRSGTEQLNLAPHSFFNLFNFTNLPSWRSPAWGSGTIRNVQATREFVVNLATRALAEQVNLSSAAVSSDVNEFDLTGLGPVKSPDRGRALRRREPREPRVQSAPDSAAGRGWTANRWRPGW